MDFVSGLSLKPVRKDSVWVIVDQFLKSAHFLEVRTNYSLQKLVELYITKIVCLHGVPVSIISDRDPRFTSRFWESLQEASRSNLNFSLAYHPQIDGQFERVIQVLEDMLRSSMIDFNDSWERYLLLADFAYNNSFQAIGDKVILKLSSWKKFLRFGRKGKLSPRYIGPDEVVKRIGSLAYNLKLSLELERIHDVLDHLDLSHIVPIEEINVEPNLTFDEEPIKILDYEVKVFRNKRVSLVKVLWCNHKVEKATWETEEAMRHQYLYELGIQCQNGKKHQIESDSLSGLPILILAISTQRYMRKGCNAYLAYVFDSRVSKLKVESVLMVCEYLDLFPEELSGLPLIREVEFAIELATRTSLISIAPYRMALTLGRTCFIGEEKGWINEIMH
ncbi:uncharacterized protein [Gossypium hirsutum]|uniref:Integrase catalytic domain-containing protein n=1 Tax=Gossypium hirsutum TaxID=3635 RepID=A0A1U8NQR6_GOSHI|nr:uncharacterized protein LOC107950075 [Gossypium hirsutum]